MIPNWLQLASRRTEWLLITKACIIFPINLKESFINWPILTQITGSIACVYQMIIMLFKVLMEVWYTFIQHNKWVILSKRNASNFLVGRLFFRSLSWQILLNSNSYKCQLLQLQIFTGLQLELREVDYSLWISIWQPMKLTEMQSRRFICKVNISPTSWNLRKACFWLLLTVTALTILLTW